MGKNIDKMATQLAREVNLIAQEDHLNAATIEYVHGTGCGGSCCRNKEPSVRFSGKNSVAEKVEFSCHITALPDLFLAMDQSAENDISDYLLRKLGQSIFKG